MRKLILSLALVTGLMLASCGRSNIDRSQPVSNGTEVYFSDWSRANKVTIDSVEYIIVEAGAGVAITPHIKKKK